MKAAETRKSICGSCAITKKWEDQEYRKKSSAARKGPKSDAFRLNLSEKNSGAGNPMYGRNVQTIWTDKYGKDVAEEKMKKIGTAISKRVSGTGNPMYGKPSPQGSGNGWSGWYKGWFFRSIRELSYMIKVIEANELQWDKPASLKWKDGDKYRTYTPDFLINENLIVEIKPRNLWNSRAVKKKAEAAKIWCCERNMNYELIDPITLTTNEIISLYKEDKIKFLPRYDDKFKNTYFN